MVKGVLILSLILGLYFVKPKLGDSEAKHLPPPSTLDKTHFGFNLIMADLLWLEFIQNSWECSSYGDMGKCAKRWPYKVLDEASQLDPKFLVLYLYGAVHLSVINDDHKGAAALFNKAFENIDDNWVLYYRAAYIHMVELNNNNIAASYLVRASDLGAPTWTRSLASKLYTKVGKIELSYRTLKALYEEVEDGPWRDEIKVRLDDLALQVRAMNKP